MADDNTAVLERELYDVKQYASELSGANERSKKEIGELRKKAEEVESLKEEKAVLQAQLDEARKQIKALEAGLAKANGIAAEGEKAIAAGKAISDALGQLNAL